MSRSPETGLVNYQPWRDLDSCSLPEPGCSLRLLEQCSPQTSIHITYKLPCMKQMSNKDILYNTGNYSTYSRSSRRGAVVMNLTRNHEVAGLIPGLVQRVKDPALL